MLEISKWEADHSKRYIKVNKLEPIIEQYIFGCEFEFYLYDNNNYENIKEELFEISNVDLLTNDVTVPVCKDSSECMHLKPDISLKDNGLEISIPKSGYNQLIQYIKDINNLIDKYGYTNNDTGFHIHISTYKKSGVNINFFKFALLCNKNKLLYSWQQRNGYCLNVMDIINCNNKKQSKKIKNRKANGDKIWNLELISSNRVEIRTIGGIDYHKNNNKILLELEQFKNIFQETLSKDTDEYINLEKLHLEKINNATPEIKIEFMKMIEPKD
jgi:hypothetical protein